MKPGDVVRLKSGGPRMTVVNKSASDTWWCVWFDGHILQEQRAFPPHCLVHAEEGHEAEEDEELPRCWHCGGDLEWEANDLECSQCGAVAPFHLPDSLNYRSIELRAARALANEFLCEEVRDQDDQR